MALCVALCVALCGVFCREIAALGAAMEREYARDIWIRYAQMALNTNRYE